MIAPSKGTERKLTTEQAERRAYQVRVGKSICKGLSIATDPFFQSTEPKTERRRYEDAWAFTCDSSMPADEAEAVRRNIAPLYVAGHPERVRCLSEPAAIYKAYTLVDPRNAPEPRLPAPEDMQATLRAMGVQIKTLDTSERVRI